MSELTTTFLECRDYGHSWRSHTVDRSADRYVVRLLCTRCGTIRSRLIDRNGNLMRSNHYHYVDGYLQPGEGLHTQEGRAKVRAFLLASLLASNLPTEAQENAR